MTSEEGRDGVGAKGDNDSVSESDMIPPGTLLLRCEPFVFVAKSPYPDLVVVCDSCLIMTTKYNCKLKRCAACQAVYYCNGVCQKKGWKAGHKFECKVMNLLMCPLPNGMPLDTRFRMLLRILAKLQDGKDYYDELAFGDTKIKRRFADLKSNLEGVREDKNALKEMEWTIDMLKILLLGVPEVKKPDDAELYEIVGKLFANEALIIGKDSGLAARSPLGTGLYLGATIFEHSCASTAINTYEGAAVCIRNYREIPKSLPIDKVTLAYIITLGTTEERQKELKETWYAHCKCEMCETGQFDKEKRSIICQKCNAEIDTEEIKQPCSACGHVLSAKEVAKVLKAKKRVHEILEADDDCSLELGQVEECIKMLKNLHFSDTNILMFRLFQRAKVSVCSHANRTGKLDDWRKAYEYASKYLLGTRRYLHPNHINIIGALHAMRESTLGLAKVTKESRLVDEADKYLSEAKAIAKIVYGEDSADDVCVKVI